MAIIINTRCMHTRFTVVCLSVCYQSTACLRPFWLHMWNHFKVIKVNMPLNVYYVYPSAEGQMVCSRKHPKGYIPAHTVDHNYNIGVPRWITCLYAEAMQMVCLKKPWGDITYIKGHLAIIILYSKNTTTCSEPKDRDRNRAMCNLGIREFK